MTVLQASGPAGGWLTLLELRQMFGRVARDEKAMLALISYAASCRGLVSTGFHHAWVATNAEGRDRVRIDFAEFKRVPVQDRFWWYVHRAERSDQTNSEVDWSRGRATFRIVDLGADEWVYNVLVYESLMFDAVGAGRLLEELSRPVIAGAVDADRRVGWIIENGASLSSKGAWAAFTEEFGKERRGLFDDFMADYRKIWPRKQGRPRKQE